MRGRLFPLREKLYPSGTINIKLKLQSNNGFKEIRFKVRDSLFQVYQDMALYFFERKVIDKPTIHEYARWCMKHMTDSNVFYMFQWKLTRDRQMQEQQNTMVGNQPEFNHVHQGPVS
jgi:uncharacterized membrane protein